MWSNPASWRDKDANAFSSDPAIALNDSERWEYIGNIFDLLPFSALSALGSEPVNDAPKVTERVGAK